VRRRVVEVEVAVFMASTLGRHLCVQSAEMRAIRAFLLAYVFEAAKHNERKPGPYWSAP